jgi:hypothetical protein
MSPHWLASPRYLKSLMTRVAAVMVAALMLAQWGAQAHTYSHDIDLPSQTDQHSHAKFCPECPSFAPVLTVAASPALYSPTLWAPIRFSDTSLPIAVLDIPIALAFRSRAPPAAAWILE